MQTQKILILTNMLKKEDYIKTIEKIDSFYDDKKYFNLLIETKQVTKINYIYLYKIGSYLNSLKNRNPQYLLETTIHVYDDNNFNILYTLFTFISSPIRKVNVIYYDGGYNNKPTDQRNIHKVKIYLPLKN
tara:strand:+ start:1892 stop:2284 length:393 start_codon:yes stop_codon:yes gene_type:complete